MRQLRSAGWVLTALLWGTAVYTWPRLRVDDSEASRNWQATADVTLATIIGTIVVLVLTVGLLAVQMLSPYGWRATRMLVNRSFYAATAAVIAGGVIAPVWVAANPSPAWTRLAFLGFGWSLLAIAAVGTSVVERMSPQALVEVVASRARTRSRRVLRRRPVLEAETEVLIELFSSPALPDSCRQQVADALVNTMATKARVDGQDFENHIESIATATEQLTSSAQLTAVVELIRRLTEDHGTVFGVRFTTGRVVRGIAADARGSGKRDVAELALDIFVALNVRWLTQLLPANHRKAPENADPGIVTYGAEVDTWNTAYDMVEDTVTVLRGHLSAPHPSSTGWPDGWQGAEAFEQDIRRIASLPIAMYDFRRQLSSDAAEQALADVADQLVGELTGAETAGRHGLVAKLLVRAMRSAYEAGFDRRALTIGQRLIAASAGAVQRNDLAAAEAYQNELRIHIPDMSHMHPDEDTEAHDSREAVLLAGLITATVPLLAASTHSADLYETVSGFVTELAFNATQTNPLLENIGWQARLAAVGWPIDPSSTRLTMTTQDPVIPLPAVVVSAAEKALTDHVGSDILAATLVLALWANAVTTKGSAPDRLRALIIATVVHYNKYAVRTSQTTYDPFYELCEAVIAWADAVDSGTATTPRVPMPDGRVQPKVTVFDRQYHGLTVLGLTAVLVVESDGSHRLLRTTDGSTSQKFTWGYTGGGPHALARALVNDGMRDMLLCPDCLGASPAAVGMVTCAHCDNTGYWVSPSEVVSLIVDRVIRHLPDLPGAEPTWPGAEWTVTSEVLADVARQL